MFYKKRLTSQKSLASWNLPTQSGQKFKRLDWQNLSPSLSVSTLLSDTIASSSTLAEICQLILNHYHWSVFVKYIYRPEKLICVDWLIKFIFLNILLYGILQTFSLAHKFIINHQTPTIHHSRSSSNHTIKETLGGQYITVCIKMWLLDAWYYHYLHGIRLKM